MSAMFAVNILQMQVIALATRKLSMPTKTLILGKKLNCNS